MKHTLTLAAAAAALALTAGAAQAQDTGDAARGEVVAKKCMACHTFEDGGANKVGPNLHGVMQRGVAKLDGYKFSDGLVEASQKQAEWTEAQLMDYLDDPTGWMRATTGDAKARSKMTFKLTDEQQRRDVIAYLQSLGG
ncbi:c-type cytochrome [Caenispirillum bisanense]|uniref:Cytochrome c n=1 Tax=Caenispirillum bisanense TaxID=414052 RepID=A0A286GIH2_9PROT|nr:c-type cytochrome [Caenispirillum bisanense]SOD95321.1 cytochrome c [Caenispirillum bisanense]